DSTNPLRPSGLERSLNSESRKRGQHKTVGRNRHRRFFLSQRQKSVQFTIKSFVLTEPAVTCALPVAPKLKRAEVVNHCRSARGVDFYALFCEPAVASRYVVDVAHGRVAKGNDDRQIIA